MTINEMLDSEDWREVFTWSNLYKREDVQEIIASSDGYNDGESWIGVFKMKDGKFIVLEASCDFTGWDCQAGGECMIYNSLNEAISKMSLGKDCRERLRDQLSNYKKDWE